MDLLRIIDGGLDHPQVVALLGHHIEQALATSPRESMHALDIDGLRGPDMSFWSIWDDQTLLGVGALKRIDDHHGEIKSMHTALAARGKGVASAMLGHIIAKARALGFQRLSLETGTQEYFRAAQQLYKKHGFIECVPFASYKVDPNSVFMTLDLRGEQD